MFRVTIPGGEGIGGARKKDKEYELSTTDAFWNKHKGSPFPQVQIKRTNSLHLFYQSP